MITLKKKNDNFGISKKQKQNNQQKNVHFWFDLGYSSLLMYKSLTIYNIFFKS